MKAKPLRLDDLLKKKIKENYRAIHRCFRLSLAEERNRGGTVFLKLTMGDQDRVADVRIARDELSHARCSECLRTLVQKWHIAGMANFGAIRGSDIYLPLTLRANPSQRKVAMNDLRQSGFAVTFLNKENVGLKAATLIVVRIKKDKAYRRIENIATKDIRQTVLWVLEGKVEVDGKRKRLYQPFVISKQSKIVAKTASRIIGVDIKKNYEIKEMGWLTQRRRVLKGPAILFVHKGTLSCGKEIIFAQEAYFLARNESCQVKVLKKSHYLFLEMKNSL